MNPTTALQRVLFAAALTMPASLSLGQGPLTPPGAPAPTMKTLSQIEPRTPVSGPQVITQPGSYYLTGDIVGGIIILANHVTLDLGGFTIRPDSGVVGVQIMPASGRSDITIRNGSIHGTGVYNAAAGTFDGTFGVGISGYAGSPGNFSVQNVRIEKMTIKGCWSGIQLSGLNEADGGRHLISDCIIQGFGNVGIFASQTVVRDTVVSSGVGSGVFGGYLVAENLIVDHITGSGIVGNNNRLHNTLVRSTSGDGIQCSYSTISGTHVSNCGMGIHGNDNQIDSAHINYCTTHGIYSSNSSVHAVIATGNGGGGIWADDSTITECSVRLSGADGIRGERSIISTCRSSGNDTNPDSYAGAGISWGVGRQVNNITNLYTPAAPAP